MNIPDNIVYQKIKNIYFIIGDACGGKSTSAKYLSDKYGMYLYSTDETGRLNSKILNIKYQPALCTPIKNYYDLSMDEVLEYEIAFSHELIPIIIADLIELSGKYDKIICEGACAIGFAHLIDYNKIIHLSTSDEIIRRDYLNRPDKAFITEKIMNDTNLTNEEKEKRIKFKQNTGLLKSDKYFQYDGKKYFRDDNSTLEDMLILIEKHFELT